MDDFTFRLITFFLIHFILFLDHFGWLVILISFVFLYRALTRTDF